MKSVNVAVIEAARAGDAAAQDELVATHLPLVYNIVGRALNGHADVDDVVQDTMLRVINGLDGLRDPASFRSWLVAITMNQIRSHCREDRPEAPVSGLQEVVGEVADPKADFVDLTIVRLGLEGQRKEAAEATRWLDDGEQEVLSLWWLEAAGELKRAEVAAALELSPQHTAVRVQRTKAQLDIARGVVQALAAQPRCPQLGEVVAHWDGVPSALWRKRIARHVRSCGRCTGALSALVPAEGLLVGLGLVPVVGALAGWWGGGSDLGAAPVGYASHAPASSAAHSSAAYASPSASPSASAAGRPRSHRAGARHHRGGGGRSRATRRAVVGAGVLALVAGGVLGGMRFFEDEPGTTVKTQAADSSSDLKQLAAQEPSPLLPTPSQSATPSASASASPSPSASSPTPEQSSKAPEAKPSTAAPERTAPSRAEKSKAPAPGGKGGGGSMGQQVVSLVNAERAKVGCSPVTSNSLLDAAAQGHSDDMAARGFFDHTNPDGKGPGDRITAAGYQWSTYGENIAYGQQDAAAVMDSWMHSDGHRKNILNCSFKEIGIGINKAPGGPRWTQVFGAR
ncbi:RNA polymerase [Streptomyces cinnamoneus]|uniref:RNA polymerase sigma factor n=1 Tax=Streptomyces cinnamoneus TaxID=53446 RepID=A0A2G1XFF1_STRCJ|nr:sigma-70 family RNA polymerase sigma factor [Streptomyces cinnamoneus]PHQ49962.1 RNA polymerase [Streptomyces cinnamoneus]PPT13261.1 RNA polymerase [Streptomyces cinnamoneus]